MQGPKYTEKEPRLLGNINKIAKTCPSPSLKDRNIDFSVPFLRRSIRGIHELDYLPLREKQGVWGAPTTLHSGVVCSREVTLVRVALWS